MRLLGFFVGTVVLFAVVDTNAAILTIVGDTGDGQIGADGSVAGTDWEQERTGTGGNNSRGLALIYFFELPAFSPLTRITNAELTLQYVEKTASPEFNIDLFGIDARPNAVFDGADYYDGEATYSSDALIQTSIIEPTTDLGEIHVANPNLLDFVNSLYNPDGTPLSKFATFRVNPDVNLPIGSWPIRGYFLALADHSTPTYRPALYLTTAPIPEPSSLLLWLGLAGIGVIAAWRRGKPAK